MSKYREELFDIMSSSQSNLVKYEKLKNNLSAARLDRASEENVKFYSLLNKLMNNINNTGWKEKKGLIMDLIGAEQERISNIYGDDLP